MLSVLMILHYFFNRNTFLLQYLLQFKFYLRVKMYTIFFLKINYNDLVQFMCYNTTLDLSQTYYHNYSNRCLYLQQNLIDKIQGLDTLRDLRVLNLCNNQILKIENLCKQFYTTKFVFFNFFVIKTLKHFLYDKVVFS